MDLVCFGHMAGDGRMFDIHPFKDSTKDIDHTRIVLTAQAFGNALTTIPH